jgi:hypothetical protein
MTSAPPQLHGPHRRRQVWREDFYFVARLFLTAQDGTSLGLFFSPLTTTTLQAPAGLLLQSPQALTFNFYTDSMFHKKGSVWQT